MEMGAENFQKSAIRGCLLFYAKKHRTTNEEQSQTIHLTGTPSFLHPHGLIAKGGKNRRQLQSIQYTVHNSLEKQPHLQIIIFKEMH